MNFKEKLAHVPLPSGSHYFPSIEHLSSLRQDSLVNDLCPNDSKSVCTPSDNDEVESIPNADACKCHLHDIVSELHKMFLSSTLMLSLEK